MVCAYWPQQGLLARPAQFAGGDYPTIILNGDADPITPIEQSYRIMDNLQNGYMVAMQGGPHVIWGRGLACPDQIVADLMIDGTLHEAPEQVCTQHLIASYTRLTLTDPADAANPLAVAQALITELYQSLGLYNWQGQDPLTIGCNHGGRATISLGDNDATAYSFAACIWWPGIMIDGTGHDIATGEPGDAFSLDLTISRDHQGQIAYRSNTYTEAFVISGNYDGAPIDNRRLD